MREGIFMLKTQYAGHLSFHPADFTYHRDSSQTDWAIIHTLTPAEFLLNDEWILYPENSIVIIAPGQKQDYRAYNGREFGNNWVSFFTNEKFITECGLPFGTPFTVKFPDIIDHIMHMIAAENAFDNSNKDQSIYHLFHLLFYKLSESIIDNNSTLDEELLKLRYNIINNPAFQWSVPLMAKTLNISTGYLQVIYKKTFGIPCMEDVFRQRIELAKDYVAHSSYSISQIADICGYQNTEHFCRQFKRITGMSASAYKKSLT